MDPLFEAILDSPDLPRQLEKLNRAWAEEVTRRERFYTEPSTDKKTEFINGMVVTHSPVKWRHAEASDLLFRLLSFHVNRRGLGRAIHEKLLVTLTRNDYEPDVAFYRQEVVDGFTADQKRFPAPGFVAEMLSSANVLAIRRVKKRDYALHGVSEYWIVDPEARTVEQLVLRGDDYECLGVWKNGEVVASTVVTGFTIPAKAVFEVSANLSALAALAV